MTEARAPIVTLIGVSVRDTNDEYISSDRFRKVSLVFDLASYRYRDLRTVAFIKAALYDRNGC